MTKRILNEKNEFEVRISEKEIIKAAKERIAKSIKSESGIEVKIKDIKMSKDKKSESVVIPYLMCGIIFIMGVSGIVLKEEVLALGEEIRNKKKNEVVEVAEPSPTPSLGIVKAKVLNGGYVKNEAKEVALKISKEVKTEMDVGNNKAKIERWRVEYKERLAEKVAEWKEKGIISKDAEEIVIDESEVKDLIIRIGYKKDARE